MDNIVVPDASRGLSVCCVRFQRDDMKVATKRVIVKVVASSILIIWLQLTVLQVFYIFFTFLFIIRMVVQWRAGPCLAGEANSKFGAPPLFVTVANLLETSISNYLLYGILLSIFDFQD